METRSGVPVSAETNGALLTWETLTSAGSRAGAEPCDRTVGAFKCSVLVNTANKGAAALHPGPQRAQKVLLRTAHLGRDARGQQRSTAAFVHALIWPAGPCRCERGSFFLSCSPPPPGVIKKALCERGCEARRAQTGGQSSVEGVHVCASLGASERKLFNTCRCVCPVSGMESSSRVAKRIVK